MSDKLGRHTLVRSATEVLKSYEQELELVRKGKIDHNSSYHSSKNISPSIGDERSLLDRAIENKNEFWNKLNIKKSPKEKKKRSRRRSILDTLTPANTQDKINQLYALERKAVLHPTSFVKKLWDCIIIILVLYTLLVVPYLIGFDATFNHDSTANLQAQYIVDGIFWLDIFLTFNTAVLNRDLIFVFDRKIIRKRYLSSYFLLDLVANFPFELILQEFFSRRLVTAVRVLRLFRISKMRRLFKFHRKTNSFRIDPLVSKPIALLIQILTLVHVFACFWFFITTTPQMNRERVPDDPLPPNNVDTNWIDALGYETHANFDKYIAALYFTFVTMLTIGYGDISPTNDKERVFAIFAMLTGAIVFAILIARVTSYVRYILPQDRYRNSKMDELKQLLIDKQVPFELKARAREAYLYYLTKKGSHGDEDIFNGLPQHLCIKVSFQIYRRHIERIELFHSYDKPFVVSVLPLIRPFHLITGEYVLKKGDYCPDIVFVSKGVVRISSPPGFIKQRRAVSALNRKESSESTTFNLSSSGSGSNDADDRAIFFGFEIALGFVTDSGYFHDFELHLNSNIAIAHYRVIRHSSMLAVDAQRFRELLELRPIAKLNFLEEIESRHTAFIVAQQDTPLPLNTIMPSDMTSRPDLWLNGGVVARERLSSDFFINNLKDPYPEIKNSSQLARSSRGIQYATGNSNINDDDSDDEDSKLNQRLNSMENMLMSRGKDTSTWYKYFSKKWNQFTNSNFFISRINSLRFYLINDRTAGARNIRMVYWDNTQSKPVMRLDYDPDNLWEDYRLINPHSHRKVLWDYFIGYIILFCAFLVPLEVCFGVAAFKDSSYVYLAIEIIFFVDIIFSLNTAYESFKEDALITIYSAVVYRYLTTWFPADLIACIPFHLIFLRATGDRIGITSLLFKLPRMYRLAKLSGKQQIFANYVNLFQDVTGVRPQQYHLSNFMITFFAVAHAIACGWFGITSLLSADPWFESLGTQNLPFIMDKLRTKYVTSLYWTIMTMTTVGYGDLTPVNTSERIFNIIVILIGSVLFAWFISKISDLTNTYNRLDFQITDRLSGLSGYLREKRFSPELTTAVLSHFEHQLKSTSGYDSSEMLQSLPPRLRVSIQMVFHKALIDVIPIFNYVTNNSLRLRLFSLMKPLKYSKGSAVVREGDEAFSIIFLVKGRAVAFKQRPRNTDDSSDIIAATADTIKSSSTSQLLAQSMRNAIHHSSSHKTRRSTLVLDFSKVQTEEEHSVIVSDDHKEDGSPSYIISEESSKSSPHKLKTRTSFSTLESSLSSMARVMTPTNFMKNNSGEKKESSNSDNDNIKEIVSGDTKTEKEGSNSHQNMKYMTINSVGNDKLSQSVDSSEHKDSHASSIALSMSPSQQLSASKSVNAQKKEKVLSQEHRSTLSTSPSIPMSRALSHKISFYNASLVVEGEEEEIVQPTIFPGILKSTPDSSATERRPSKQISFDLQKQNNSGEISYTKPVEQNPWNDEWRLSNMDKDNSGSVVSDITIQSSSNPALNPYSVSANSTDITHKSTLVSIPESFSVVEGSQNNQQQEMKSSNNTDNEKTNRTSSSLSTASSANNRSRRKTFSDAALEQKVRSLVLAGDKYLSQDEIDDLLMAMSTATSPANGEESLSSAQGGSNKAEIDSASPHSLDSVKTYNSRVTNTAKESNPSENLNANKNAQSSATSSAAVPIAISQHLGNKIRNYFQLAHVKKHLSRTELLDTLEILENIDAIEDGEYGDSVGSTLIPQKSKDDNLNNQQIENDKKSSIATGDTRAANEQTRPVSNIFKPTTSDDQHLKRYFELPPLTKISTLNPASVSASNAKQPAGAGVKKDIAPIQKKEQRGKNRLRDVIQITQTEPDTPATMHSVSSNGDGSNNIQSPPVNNSTELHPTIPNGGVIQNRIPSFIGEQYHDTSDKPTNTSHNQPTRPQSDGGHTYPLSDDQNGVDASNIYSIQSRFSLSRSRSEQDSASNHNSYRISLTKHRMWPWRGAKNTPTDDKSFTVDSIPANRILFHTNSVGPVNITERQDEIVQSDSISDLRSNHSASLNSRRTNSTETFPARRADFNRTVDTLDALDLPFKGFARSDFLMHGYEYLGVYKSGALIGLNGLSDATQHVSESVLATRTSSGYALSKSDIELLVVQEPVVGDILNRALLKAVQHGYADPVNAHVGLQPEGLSHEPSIFGDLSSTSEDHFSMTEAVYKAQTNKENTHKSVLMRSEDQKKQIQKGKKLASQSRRSSLNNNNPQSNNNTAENAQDDQKGNDTFIDSNNQLKSQRDSSPTKLKLKDSKSSQYSSSQSPIEYVRPTLASRFSFSSQRVKNAISYEIVENKSRSGEANEKELIDINHIGDKNDSVVVDTYVKDNNTNIPGMSPINTGKSISTRRNNGAVDSTPPQQRRPLSASFNHAKSNKASGSLQGIFQRVSSIAFLGADELPQSDEEDEEENSSSGMDFLNNNSNRLSRKIEDITEENEEDEYAEEDSGSEEGDEEDEEEEDEGELLDKYHDQPSPTDSPR